MRRLRVGFAEPGLVACEGADCMESARPMDRCGMLIELRVGVLVCI